MEADGNQNQKQKDKNTVNIPKSCPYLKELQLELAVCLHSFCTYGWKYFNQYFEDQKYLEK